MPAYGPMAAYSSSTHNGFSSPAPSAKCRIVSSVASELNCLIRRGTPIRVLTRSISSSVMTSIELKTSLLKCPRFVEYQQTRRAARAHLLGGADPSKVRTNSPQSVNASCESLPSARLRRQGRRTPVSAESHPMAGRHPRPLQPMPAPLRGPPRSFLSGYGAGRQTSPFECFEPHRPGLHMADDVLLARLGAGLATDIGGNDFSPLCVRFRDDRRVQHGWG